MNKQVEAAQAAIRAMDEADAADPFSQTKFSALAEAGRASIAAIRALPSGEPVAWLRMRPDGRPDWAEDCIAENEHFLDSEMASDGYYLQPLYTTPPVVAEPVAWRWLWNGIVKSDWNMQAECPAPVGWTNPAWTIEYTTPPVVEVTEAMVLRGLRGLANVDPNSEKDHLWPDNMRADMHRALTAALQLTTEEKQT